MSRGTSTDSGSSLFVKAKRYEVSKQRVRATSSFFCYILIFSRCYLCTMLFSRWFLTK